MFFFVPSINSIVDQELTQFCGVDMADLTTTNIGKKLSNKKKTPFCEHFFLMSVFNLT